jgi:hypothetical protein
VDEVAVCTVDLDKVDVCFEGSFGGFDECLDKTLELVRG